MTHPRLQILRTVAHSIFLLVVEAEAGLPHFSVQMMNSTMTYVFVDTLNGTCHCYHLFYHNKSRYAKIRQMSFIL